MFATFAVLLGLGLGICVKRWRLVLALVIAGLTVSLVAWQIGWFGDEETRALGGAIVFELMIAAPAAIGAAIGVYLVRSRSRRGPDDTSTLPIVGPPPEHRHHR